MFIFEEAETYLKAKDEAAEMMAEKWYWINDLYPAYSERWMTTNYLK